MTVIKPELSDTSPSELDMSLKSTEDFPKYFNREPFAVEHNLAGNPLFEIPRLHLLANRLLEEAGNKSVRCLTGNKGVDAGWSDLDEALDQLDASFDNLEQREKAWILVKDIMLDPEYKAGMESIIDQVKQSLGSMGGEITWPEPYFFISSPGFVTPYHIDHEAGLLLQIAGTKVFTVFDGRDRDVLPEETIENFYMGKMSAAKFNSQVEERGRKFAMNPGDGVCFPGLGPHWAQTGDSYSVTLSIGFGQVPKEKLARVYQTNHYLRRLGINPRPPGISPVLDTVKRAPLSLLTKRNPESMGDVLRSGVNRVGHVLGKLRGK